MEASNEINNLKQLPGSTTKQLILLDLKLQYFIFNQKYVSLITLEDLTTLFLKIGIHSILG